MSHRDMVTMKRAQPTTTNDCSVKAMIGLSNVAATYRDAYNKIENHQDKLSNSKGCPGTEQHSYEPIVPKEVTNVLDRTIEMESFVTQMHSTQSCPTNVNAKVSIEIGSFDYSAQ